MKLYKILDKNSVSNHAALFADFDYSPYLPKKDKPGPWLPVVEGTIRRCYRGYHLTENPELWIASAEGIPMVYEAQGRDERVYIRPDDKRVFRTIRLLRQVPRREWLSEWKEVLS